MKTASEKQINCIHIIYDNVNYHIENANKSDRRKEFKEKQKKCFDDYYVIEKLIKKKNISSFYAGKFISKWLDFSKEMQTLRRLDNRDKYSSWSYESREVGLYCESDLFLTEMFY